MNTRLCDKCKCLEIDDASLGGFERFDDYGDSFLVLDDEDNARQLGTNFFFDDNFPLLPRLTESARTGCDFCGWLKETILKAQLMPRASDTPVNLHIHYLFAPEELHRPELNRGLRALLVIVTFPLDGNFPTIISCDIDSNSGMKNQLFS